MSLAILIETVAFCSLLPAALFVWNVFLFREPPKGSRSNVGSVSVLIPARNEERSIAAAVKSVLSSRSVDFEVIVLDDDSSDHTSEIVANIAARDPRVRLVSAPTLPAGWNGKQHACFVLASVAQYDTFCFLDADVRLEPEALVNMASFLDTSRADIVSGFPLQETETFLEWLLLPLIHFVLLAYLPIAGMRLFNSPGFAAGCGQFVMVRREAYEDSGGHSQIRSTMHDGLLLPRLLRRYGYRTDIADLTNLATCRMYRNAAEVWNGLAKNASEGLGAPSRILIFSCLLLFGQVAPVILAVCLMVTPSLVAPHLLEWVFAAVVASFLPRLIAVIRFRQKLASALLHPMGIAVLLVLQWYSFIRKVGGQSISWKQRAYSSE